MPLDTLELAKALIGCVLVSESPRGRAAGRIVETEAYPPGDPAGHAYIGKTPRNASLFGPAHRAYVYQIYGTSFCFNVSSECEGIGAGVLVRALEPLAGIDLMRHRRSTAVARDLARGPGRLCMALAITREHDGLTLTPRGPLWLARPVEPPQRIRSTRRIGITKAAAEKLRFHEEGNPYVSSPRSLR